MSLTAIVLCGGLGSRMGEITKTNPKTLLMVHDKPIIWYTIMFLFSQGVRKFIFPLGYLGDKIKFFIETELSFLGANMYFVDTGENTAIHLRIKAIQNLLERNKNIVLLNSDTLFDFSLSKMYQEHVNTESQLTLSTAQVISPWGIVNLKGSDPVSFKRERVILKLSTIEDENSFGRVYSGLCIINQKVFNNFDWNRCVDFEKEMFNMCISNYKTSVYEIDGLWYPIDTDKDLATINFKIGDNGGDEYQTYKKLSKFQTGLKKK